MSAKVRSGHTAHYAHLGGRNAAGPTAADLSFPARVDAQELARRVAPGEWIVDVRDRLTYTRTSRQSARPHQPRGPVGRWAVPSSWLFACAVTATCRNSARR